MPALRQSFPTMDELQKKYGDRLVVLAVNVDEKASNMDKFLKKHPVTFTVARDAANAGDYGTVRIDERHRILQFLRSRIGLKLD